MPSNFDELQKLGKEQLEAASSLTASLAKGLQGVVAEATEFSKKSIEANSAYIERLMSAKSLEDTVQVQSEYAKSAYGRLIAQITKLGELYADLAKESFRPVEAAMARFKATPGGGRPDGR